MFDTIARILLAGTLLAGSCIALFVALQSIGLFPWLMLASALTSLCCLVGACSAISDTSKK